MLAFRVGCGVSGSVNCFGRCPDTFVSRRCVRCYEFCVVYCRSNTVVRLSPPQALYYPVVYVPVTEQSMSRLLRCRRFFVQGTSRKYCTFFFPMFTHEGLRLMVVRDILAVQRCPHVSHTILACFFFARIVTLMHDDEEAIDGVKQLPHADTLFPKNHTSKHQSRWHKR